MTFTRVSVQVLGEKLGVPRGEAAVAPDIDVPSVVGGDDPDVLAAGLGALARAPGHAQLDLVRAAQPAVAQLRAMARPTESWP